jgi:hypothetical protein
MVIFYFQYKIINFNRNKNNLSEKNCIENKKITENKKLPLKKIKKDNFQLNLSFSGCFISLICLKFDIQLPF